MIEIFAHRGLWEEPEDQNTLQAFQMAFEQGLNIETDIRDFDGSLIISHDPETKDNPLRFHELLRIKNGYPDLTIALNIKSDGLGDLLEEFEFIKQNDEFLFFDGSFPSMRELKQASFLCLERLSEYEKISSFDFDGLWIDAFEKDWFLDNQEIFNIKYEKIIFVSPELHKRDYKLMWDWLRLNIKNFSSQVGLCTDYPLIARSYFESN